MKVFLTGATGVMGTAAARALVLAGHETAGLARTLDKAHRLEGLGVTPVGVSLFDEDQLAGAFSGYDAVCNLATHIPVGHGGMRPGAWRLNDRIRIEGSRAVSRAAKAADVRRIVQESVSFMYADGGDSWLDESSVLAVTRATEPSAVAETHAGAFACAHRSSVVLRFAAIIGDDPLTRWRLARARAGQPVGVGEPTGWAHVVHPVDVGEAVVSALHAPSGVYNVGAKPVLRAELTSAFGHAGGRDDASYLPKMMVRLAGERLEPLTRSHRISSDRFGAATGWSPRFDTFSETWLTALAVDAP